MPDPKGRRLFVNLGTSQNVNLRELDCDSYSASAHKWFVGPKEVGILYVRKERLAKIWPHYVAPG